MVVKMLVAEVVAVVSVCSGIGRENGRGGGGDGGEDDGSSSSVCGKCV